MGNVMEAPTPTADPFMAAIDRLQRTEDPQGQHPAQVPGGHASGVAGWQDEGPGARTEVGPGAEGAAVPGDHHRPHVVVGVGLVEHFEELGTHGAGEGVEAVGTVEGDRGHPGVDLVDQGGGHRTSPPFSGRRPRPCRREAIGPRAERPREPPGGGVSGSSRPARWPGSRGRGR